MQAAARGKVDIDAQNFVQKKLQLGEFDKAASPIWIPIDEYVDIRGWP